MLVELNKENFKVNNNEFLQLFHEVYNNLKIIPDLAKCERTISLISELSLLYKDKINLVFLGTSHGGYTPIKCSKNFRKIFILEYNTENIKYNIDSHNINNILINTDIEEKVPYILFVNDPYMNIQDIINKDNPIIVSENTYNYQNIFKLTNSKIKIYIPTKCIDMFKNIFSYYLDSSYNLNYDNLIHLAVMVKNGGKDFEKMLNENLDIIDRWTILDTGSTDNTIDVIKNTLVGKKKGELFQEPFINFKESRNRCLDLCGTSCKFIIMLDDTYCLKGSIRDFLNIVRGDQFASSYSLYIKSDDTEYASNRIIKSEYGLRYIYKIHEVIQAENNINVCIPIQQSYIYDLRSSYMEKRTMDRKYYDLKLLFEMVEEEPEVSRHLYYIAQTYNILEKYELAYEFFLKRGSRSDGFIQEQIDSYFEAARLANFKLNKEWETCFDLYMKSYELDKSRPDSMYFIGIHYYLEKNFEEAYKYFVKAFEIGYPVHTQHSLKPTLSFYFLPRYLAELSFYFKNYNLGIQACELFLQKNKKIDDFYNIIISWYSIFNKLIYKLPQSNISKPIKPIICFIADGGFSKWNGSSINTEGVGGSETCIIEISRYINNYDVYVFCNCSKEEKFDNVNYRDLKQLYTFLSENYIEKCIVSRYTEYLPLCFESNIEDIYLILHDLIIPGTVIPINERLKKIFCLSESHKLHFVNYFPCFKDIVEVFNYGIDESFLYNPEVKKVKNKFIYSSFSNRGLSVLLKLWPKIKDKLKDASLHIYCDFENSWVNTFHKDNMEEIRSVYNSYKNLDIYYYGWVDKVTLAKAWATSHVWFYPCIFEETFCLTALECAASKTICITNDLGSLKEVCSKGVIVNGDANSKEWQEKALETLFRKLEEYEYNNKIVENNFSWAKSMLWKNRNFQSILSDEKYEYANMYNWTNDMPQNTKKNFISILTNISNRYSNRECNILEIGTYTGTSIINIMNFFKNPKACVIDKWENYTENTNGEKNELLDNIINNNIETIFYKNISRAGLLNKIKIIKKDSTLALLEDVHENFDLIYIDGSHTLLDSFSDIILCWKILNNGGVLIIDDVQYNKHTILESPFEGVQHFLKKFNGKYKILNFDYRLFLEKL
jgi:predicted O-methyltransferase YrrM